MSSGKLVVVVATAPKTAAGVTLNEIMQEETRRVRPPAIEERPRSIDRREVGEIPRLADGLRRVELPSESLEAIATPGSGLQDRIETEWG